MKYSLRGICVDGGEREKSRERKAERERERKNDCEIVKSTEISYVTIPLYVKKTDLSRGFSCPRYPRAWFAFSCCRRIVNVK